jgi:epoxide hydrolase-like predicted phosphatase
VLRAIFFDFGGVILRTEYQAPRQHLAERLNMEYEDLVRLVFESETSRKASIGAVTVDEHWAAVAKKLKRPASEAQSIRDEFFGGDLLDRELINTIRSLRGKYKIGLISNAWNDLRTYLAKEKIADIFDAMIISAEVGAVKPDARIYQFALEQLKVPAEAALFVDDFAANIEGCEKVGMKGLLFKDPEEINQKLKALI